MGRLSAAGLAIVGLAGGLDACTAANPPRVEQLMKDLEAANVCTAARKPAQSGPSFGGVSPRDVRVCTVNPRHDLTVWASASRKTTMALVAKVRQLLPANCVPLPDGVARSEVSSSIKWVVGERFVASTDVPQALNGAHVVLGGRIVRVGPLKVCPKE